MSELFKVSMKSTSPHDKKIRVLYVVEQDKKSAISYVNRMKTVDFEISRVCYLGYELSRCMFKGGQK